jgi:hypothetical protein
VELGAVHAAADDGAVRGPGAAEPHEGILERGLELVLLGRFGQLHRLAVPLGADFRRAAQQGHLGGALARAELVHDRVGVLHLEAAVASGHSAHELLAAGEGVLQGEVGVTEVGEAVEGEAGAGERVDDPVHRREGAGRHSHGADDHGRVGASSVIEGAAGADGGEEERRRPSAAPHHHHHRRVGLVEVGEIVKGRELIEGAEVGDRRPAAKGDHHAVADAGGERVAAGGVFGGGDLRAGGRGGCREGGEGRGQAQPGGVGTKRREHWRLVRGIGHRLR